MIRPNIPTEVTNHTTGNKIKAWHLKKIPCSAAIARKKKKRQKKVEEKIIPVIAGYDSEHFYNSTLEVKCWPNTETEI